MKKSVHCATLILVALLIPACGNDKRFDSKTWLNVDSRERGRMSQDLVDSKTLNGRSMEQVKLMLGVPQNDWGRVIQYQIDLGWPLKDPKRRGLQVHFDADQMVQDVKIVD